MSLGSHFHECLSVTVWNRERSYMTETALLRNLTYIKNYKNSVIWLNFQHFLNCLKSRKMKSCGCWRKSWEFWCFENISSPFGLIRIKICVLIVLRSWKLSGFLFFPLPVLFDELLKWPGLVVVCLHISPVSPFLRYCLQPILALTPHRRIFQSYLPLFSC